MIYIKMFNFRLDVGGDNKLAKRHRELPIRERDLI